MAENSTRIEQFRKMVDGAPGDPLGHYSLGRALLEAGDAAGAELSFAKVVELDPKISKAYQLLADAQMKQGRREPAIESLKRGATIAHERGDNMPKKDMLAALSGLGIEMPELAVASKASQQAGEGQVQCSRCNQIKARMVRAPFKSPLGQEIFAKVCHDCFREWIAQGTKVINELRLPMSDPGAQKVYDQHLKEFLNLG